MTNPFSYQGRNKLKMYSLLSSKLSGTKENESLNTIY